MAPSGLEKLSNVLSIPTEEDYQKGFVVFEGTDQSGKTLQAMKVVEEFPLGQIILGHQPSSPLEQMGFPGNDWKLLKKIWANLTPLSRWLLHAASHAQHYVDLEPYFLEQKAVLLDRFWWSAYAYNFCADNLEAFGITKQQFLFLELAATRMYSPELVIYFHGNVTEISNPRYNKKLEQGYGELIDITKQHAPGRLQVVDVWRGRRTEDIHTEIMAHLEHIGFGK